MSWIFISMVVAVYLSCFRQTFRMLDRASRKKLHYVEPANNGYYSYGYNEVRYDGKVTWTKFLGSFMLALIGCMLVTPWVLAENAIDSLSTNTGADRLSRVLAGESRKDKIARLEAEAREREDRITSLEQEVGV